MPEQVEFINREKELALIDELINQWGTRHILCVYAAGGIGKTRLLQEIRSRYIRENLRVTDIIDFDDQSLHVAQNLIIRIAQTLDEIIFTPFLSAMDDYRRMERIGVSSKRLADDFNKNTQLFIDCFNILSKQKRVVILFDTIEKIHGTDYLRYILNVFGKLTNFFHFIFGRNADKIGSEFQFVNNETVHLIELFPLEQTASKEYLRKKRDMLHIRLESEVSEKILSLSRGKPIIMDLAIEWLSRDIPNWLLEYDIESLSEEKKKTLQEMFERQLVSHIVQTRSKMEILFLLMSHVYPLDVPLMNTILKISEDEAQSLFDEARTYVFVKSLPDKRLTLHDEMRRMINSYVWDEIDPDKDRRRKYSKLTIEYFEKNIEYHSIEIQKLKENEENKRVALERKTWNLKAQHLKHSLFIDINKGVEAFVQAFDEAARNNQLNFIEILIIQAQEYNYLLSDNQRYKVDIRRIKIWFHKGNYEEGKKIAENILNTNIISPEQEVETLILYSNTEIRLGHVEKAIFHFKKAIEISKVNNLSIWLIKSYNGLGWAYRIMGDLENAKYYYSEARKLYLKQDSINKKKLEDDYGWIMNNLSRLLSFNIAEIESAVNTAWAAIQHWKKIDNTIGLGAAYLVLGSAYHKVNAKDEAFNYFEKALDIFKKLKIDDWIAQVYSWRGDLYYDNKDYSNAEKDLNKSLEIGTLNIKPMTLTILGRLYTAQDKLDLAEKILSDAIASAKEVSDIHYWLGALGRLIIVSLKKGDYQKFDELRKKLEEYLNEYSDKIKNDKGIYFGNQGIYLGIAYIGLAGLGFRHNDMSKKDDICNFLKEGIPLLVKRSFYKDKDISERLAEVEKGFADIKPELIQSVGQVLIDFFNEKEVDDVSYGIITSIMYKWANWKGKNNADEKE